MPSPNYTYTYKTGGSLAAYDPSYVERGADKALYRAVKQGQFAFVFNCRQMGKSSLGVRTLNLLRADRVCCAYLDLSKQGVEQVTAAQWYRTLIGEINRALELLQTWELDAWLDRQGDVTPAYRLDRFIDEVLLVQRPHQPITIFVDEIDTVLALDFPASDFFAWIRACYNRRADNPDYNRLTFVLLGVTTPSQLIRDTTRTPFNIGTAIELTPLLLENAAGLAEGLAGWVADPQRVLAEIFVWTGGQPYLTQRLCELVQEQAQEASALPWIGTGDEVTAIAALVEAMLIQNWEMKDDHSHLKTIRDRLLRREQLAGRLLGIYDEVLRQGQVPKDNSDAQMELRLSGLVVAQNGHLRVYNPIYRQIFDADWVQRTLDGLRPYAESLSAWRRSGYGDEALLLRGQALTEAEAWAQNRALSDEDASYLRASQALENRKVRFALRQAKVINQKAEQKRQQLERLSQEAEVRIRQQNQKIRLRSRLLAMTSILTFTSLIVSVAGAFFSANAFKDIDLAREVAGLEREGEKALRFFQTKQSEALWSAFKAAHKANQIYNSRGKEYLAYSPILALQNNLNQIREIRLEGHEAWIADAAFSPQGDRIVTSSRDGIVRLWSIKGKLLKEMTGHHTWTSKVVFSPQGDRIVIKGLDGIIRLWDGHGNIVKEIKTDGSGGSGDRIDFSPLGNQFVVGGHSEKIWIFDREGILINKAIGDKVIGDIGRLSLPPIYSPQGDYIATAGGSDKTVRLWDSDGLLVKELEIEKQVVQIVFSSQKNHAAILGSDGTVWLWDIQSQLTKELLTDVRNSSVAFNPQGSLVATGGDDGVVRLWNSQGQLLKEMAGHTHWVERVVFNIQGDRIATSGRDRTVRLWDGQGQLIRELENHTGHINYVEFSLQGDRIVTSNINGKTHLWDKQGRPLWEILSQVGNANRLAWIERARFSPQGEHIATRDEDNTIRLWQIQENSIWEIHTKNTHSITDMQISNQGDRIATSDVFGTVNLWDYKGKHIQKIIDNSGWSASIFFSPKNDSIATLASDGVAKLWDWQGNFLWEITDHPGGVSQLAFSPLGDFIVTGGKEHGTVRLWNSEGKLIKNMDGHSDWINQVIFSPDGSRIASLGSDQLVRLWNSQGQLVKEVINSVESSITRLDFHRMVFNPKGDRIAIGYSDGTVVLLDQDGQLVQEMHGHTNDIRQIVFSPCGDLIATKDESGVVWMWNSQGEPIREIAEHLGGASHLTFSPHSELVTVGNHDGTLGVWDGKGKLIRRMNTGQVGSIYRVDFSSQDNLMATYSAGDSIHIWDWENGQQISQYDNGALIWPDWSSVVTLSQPNGLQDHAKIQLWPVYTLDRLDDLLAAACQRLTPYLAHNPTISDDDRALCNLPPLNPPSP